MSWALAQAFCSYWENILWHLKDENEALSEILWWKKLRNVSDSSNFWWEEKIEMWSLFSQILWTESQWDSAFWSWDVKSDWFEVSIADKINKTAIAAWLFNLFLTNKKLISSSQIY